MDFSSTFSTLKIGIFSLLLSFASLFGNIDEFVQNKVETLLGSQFATAGERYFLSGSGISETQTTINLTKFGYTNPDGSYHKFNMGNFGDLGCATVQPGNSKGKQEFVSFTGLTQNSDGTAQLTGISRGLERTSPYIASTTLQTSHVGGSDLVLSNSPPCFYENYVTINNAETIESVKTFGSTTPPQYDANITATGNQFVSANQLNSTALQGAGTSTESVLGLVRLADKIQAAAGTASSTTGAPLVLSSRYSNATYNPAESNQLVVTGASNTIDANYIATSSQYSFTGAISFVNATSTSFAVSGAALHANGVDYRLPSAQGAASSTLKNDGSGNLIWELPDLIELADVTLDAASSTWSISVPNRKLYKIHIVADNTTGAIWGISYNGKVAVGNFETRFSINGLADTFTIANNYCQVVSGTNFGEINIDATLNNSSSTIKNFLFQTSTSTVGVAPGRSEGVCAHRTAETISNITVFVSAGSINAGSRVIIYGSRN